MTLKTLTFITILFSCLHLWAHGEDEPGPHGGHIKMPGAFHTELVVESPQAVRFYLIDLSFQNPTVKDSTIVASFRNAKAIIPLNCAAEKEFFICRSEKKLPPQGELSVKATRNKAVGNEVVYKFPVKPFANKTKDEATEVHYH